MRRRMENIRKIPVLGGQGILRSRRRLTATTTTWDATAILVLIKVIIDGHVL